jgi:lauroyl/myristoyl acyltransferase
MSLITFTHSAAGRIFFRQPRALCYLAARMYGLYLYLSNRGGARADIVALVRKALGVGALRAHCIACQASVTSAKCFFDSAMLMYGATDALREWNRGNRFEGLEHFNAAAAAGRGVILAASNFACFYYAMMTSLPPAMSTNGATFALVRPRLDAIDPQFDSLCAKIAEVSGRTFSYIETGGQRAALDFIGTLRAGGVVICMVDYIDADTLAVPSSFFGQPSCLPGGYLMIAERTGAPIVSCHTRYENGQFVTRFGRPVDPARCPDDEPMLWLAQSINAELEQQVRAAPGQWAAWGSVRMKWDLGQQIAGLG